MKSPAKKRTTGGPPARLRASEYGRNAVDMAKFLLGTILCRRLDDGTVLRARIVETEAYFGEEDTACHAHRGRTPRTDVMYAPGGFAYVYLCYGMHAMLNVVTGPVGHPEAVLVRGVEGAVGPGRLTKALGVTCALNRENLVESERLWIESDGAPPRFDASPRIGIGYASKRDRERKWRFSVRSSAAPFRYIDEKSAARFRAALRRSRRTLRRPAALPPCRGAVPAGTAETRRASRQG